MSENLKTFKHDTLLGNKEVQTPFITVAGYECPENEFCKKIEREIAFDFLVQKKEQFYSKNYVLKATEIEGILYFLRLKSSQLAKILGLTRSTLSNAILGTKKISPQLSVLLLDCIEKELLFKNYFMRTVNQNISVEKDEEFFKLLSFQKIDEAWPKHF